MYQQLNLWEYQEDLEKTNSQAKPISKRLSLPDGDAIFYPNLFNRSESDRLFDELFNHTCWRQDSIKFYGKSVPLPRLTAWYGDSGKVYTYSNIEMHPHPWNSALLTIKSKIESLAGVEFNSVLLNLYRDGKDSVAWHSDDELELGKNPIIGSVSFGGTRRFVFRRKDQKNASKVEIELTHGSGLIMQGTTQHFWQHQIPKTSKPVNPRINLTFRIIV